MEESFIESKTHDLAKSLGFTAKCTYDFGDNICIGMVSQSLLARWIREKHNIHCDAPYSMTNLKQTGYKPDLTLTKGSQGEHWMFILADDSPLEYFKTYEEAMESGLMKALEYIKQKNNGTDNKTI